MRFSYLAFLMPLVCLLSVNKGAAQQTRVKGIKVIGRAYSEKILLRWAPETPVIWEQANKYGYTVERYTIMRNESILEKPEKLVIGDIKPAPLQNWDSFSQQNDYAAVTAQALYGETFELTRDNDRTPLQIYQKTKELTQRFSFALFSADQSFKTAELAGLAYQDKEVKEDEKYLYRVYANIPAAEIRLDTGLVYISSSEIEELTSITEFYGSFSNGVVSLRWDQASYSKIYNSFVIERAIGEGSFKPITKRPIVNAYKTGQSDQRYGFFTDSVINNMTYYYRIRGRNSFGELGPLSEIVSGVPTADNELSIRIIGSQTEDGAVKIKWELHGPNTDRVERIDVLRCESINGKYSKINKEPLDYREKDWLDGSPLSTAYYKVSFVTSNLDKESMPYLVQIEDNIPPKVPSNLKSAVSSEGEINLRWTKNKEADFLGYKVYRSNFKNSEFTEVTSEPLKTNLFIDKINMQSLDGAIYYKVRSLDNRYNLSDYSETLIVKKPDLISPSAPVIKDYKIENGNLSINFIPSSSADLRDYKLVYAANQEGKWQSFRTIDKNTNQIKLTIPDSINGAIGLVAVDINNNKSEIAQTLQINFAQNYDDVLYDLTYFFDVRDKSLTLKWKTKNEEIKGYQLYRTTPDGRTVSFMQLGSDLSEFKLKDLKGDQANDFAIQAILKDRKTKFMRFNIN